MKKKNGFTLIELLAVIVILAIIALIATPLVLKYIDSSRKEAKVDSSYAFIRNLESEMATYTLKNNGQQYGSGLKELADLADLDTKVKGENPDNVKVCITTEGYVEKGILKYKENYYVSYNGKKSVIATKDDYDSFNCSGSSEESNSDDKVIGIGKYSGLTLGETTKLYDNTVGFEQMDGEIYESDNFYNFNVDFPYIQDKYLYTVTIDDGTPQQFHEFFITQAVDTGDNLYFAGNLSLMDSSMENSGENFVIRMDFGKMPGCGYYFYIKSNDASHKIKITATEILSGL